MGVSQVDLQQQHSAEARKPLLSQRMRFLIAEKVAIFVQDWSLQELTCGCDQNHYKTRIPLNKIIHIFQPIVLTLIPAKPSSFKSL